MDIDLAREVVRGAFRSAQELQALLPRLKAGCSAEEYQAYARAIGAAVAEITLQVVNRALEAHPELEAEVEASIARTGAY